ncbi:MAG: hypothetical protein KBG48_25970 [Kofleriaceae bacterium]|jgi:hypothetical protein|nr:hypothetical protein [Kofleriaceae bacterium]MBP9170871.1 hypothetical protein [Kofleriaceae bacterium]MBP9863517.1 hypothetical protein [Kofleriaceae bacterium]
MAQKTTTKTTAKTAKTAKVAKAAKPAKAPKPATGPLAKVKALYGGKDKLVDKLAGALVHDGADEGSIKDRLAKASNAQLLRLANVSEAVKKAYGSRDKLIDALAKALGKAKDKDYLAKLGGFPLPRLLDLAKSAERRAKKA